MADKVAILKELYTRNSLPEKNMAMLQEMESRGQLETGLDALSQNEEFLSSLKSQPVEPQQQKVENKKEEKGVVDYLDALWEGYKGGASMALQGVALPVSGVAGIAKSLTSGIEAGAKTIEEIQKFAGEIIPAKKAEEEIGKVVQAGMSVPGVTPVVETAMKVPEKIGDLTMEGALKLGLSPEVAAFFGAVGASALPAAIEILGIKGTFAAKKGLLKRIIKKSEKSEFYDSVGDLKPEMRKALDDAGIGLDEIDDVLPENITTQSAAGPIAEVIKKKRMSDVAESFDPDIKKIEEFESLDIDYLPQYVANNPTSKAIAENLKDIPGSILAHKEKQILEQLGKKADEIIVKGGGTIEKGDLASRYVIQAEEIVDELAVKANGLYDTIRKQVPGKTRVDTNKIISKLNSISDELGGKQYMSAKERMLLKALDPSTNPTYSRLDMLRRQIGEQLGKADTQFRNVDRKVLGDLYDALTLDQEIAVKRIGGFKLKNQFRAAKSLVAQRKGIEKQLQDVVGKRLTGDVTKKMGIAVKQLGKGHFKTFDNLLSKIPKELGKDMRRDLVTTALNDAFLAGARSKDSISIGGFGSWWKSLNRNPQAMSRLRTELGPKTWKRVNTLARVNNSIKSSMELSVKTGRQLSTAGLFDEVNKIGARAYGLVQRAGARTPMASKIFGKILDAPKNARSIAADELLSDRKFQNILRRKAMGRVSTPLREENINKMIGKLGTYKKWKKTLTGAELSYLIASGALGFFSNNPPEEEPAQ